MIEFLAWILIGIIYTVTISGAVLLIIQIMKSIIKAFKKTERKNDL
jgi:hypothetical protein